jgi:prophage maintenance system killer protein
MDAQQMEHENGRSVGHEAESLSYLTVQDMLWINLRVTKKVQHFRFAKLEEATFYQYGYGASKDLAVQAGRFLRGFIKLRPLDAGNEATAFVGCAAFLILNGSDLDLSDEAAVGWIEKVRSGQVRAEESLPIKKCVCPIHPQKVAEAVASVFEQFPVTIGKLGNVEESHVSH